MKTQLPMAVELLSDELREDLAEIEDAVTTYSLADALREGASKGTQMHGNWVGPNGSVCALSMAAAAVRSRGLA